MLYVDCYTNDHIDLKMMLLDTTKMNIVFATLLNVLKH
jgi:hypothetical protein